MICLARAFLFPGSHPYLLSHLAPVITGHRHYFDVTGTGDFLGSNAWNVFFWLGYVCMCLGDLGCW